MTDRETIARAAVLLPRGQVNSVEQPLRHHDALRSAVHEHGYFWGEVHGAEQGFFTSTGRFVDRREACAIATAAGQIVSKTLPADQLFSEDLW